MRVLQYAVSVFCVAFLCFVTPARGMEATSPSPLLPQSPLLISAYSFDQNGLPQYLEIYNNSSTTQPVSEWSFALKWGARAESDVVTHKFSKQLSDHHGVYLAPGSYTIVSFNGVVNDAHVQIDGLTVELQNYIAKVSLEHTGYRPYERTMTAGTTQSPMRLNQGATGYTSTYRDEDRAALWSTEWYQPLDTTPLRIVEVYPNAADCVPFDENPLCADYVKLYNESDEAVDLSQVRIRTGSSAAGATLSGLLPARSFISLPITLANSGGWVWIEDVYGIMRYDTTAVEYVDGGNKRGQAWSFDETNSQWRWSAYPTPYNTPNQFTDGSPVNDCGTLRLSEIAANSSSQFVEVYNAGQEQISLRGCQMQTNRSQSESYVFDDITLEAGEYTVVQIADTRLSLTKTTSGTVYILSSDRQSEIDARSYENLNENTSFALVDGVWRQTFLVTPGAANSYQEYPACDEGYVRNTDTGRCNKITTTTATEDCGLGRYRSAETGRCRNETTASTLTPCRDDQYRSPETNRCRNVATSASALTPCKPGQERNPATNRCRSTATAASSLKPCAAGQERNPETNRCRKVTSGDADAGYKVAESAASGDRLASWLALGGVGVAALSYAVWEWRREIYGMMSKVLGALPFGK